MQSTGQTSTQALSLTSMHGSTITYVIGFLPCTEQVRRPLGSYGLPIHPSKWESGLKGEPGIWLAFSSGSDLASSRGASGLRGVDVAMSITRMVPQRVDGRPGPSPRLR